MPSIRSRLLATVASLTVVFGGAVAAEAQAPKAKQAELATVTQAYHTDDSKNLAALEARLNAERPAGAPRVVFVDPDVMSTWLQLTGDATQYTSMLQKYLASKNVAPLAPQTAAAVAALSLGMQTGSVMPAPGADAQKQACVVIPYNPNLSSQAYMARAFNLKNAETGDGNDLLKGLKLDIPVARAQMEEIVNSREAWGCFDGRYVKDVAQTKDFDQVMALHRLEVFKDLGGVMQAVKDGADPAVIGRFADFRATLSALSMRAGAGMFAPDELPFYSAVIHETAPALDELASRISAMGVDKFRKLSGAEMMKLAEDVTARAALTPAQATHLMGFSVLGENYFRGLALGKADPAAMQAAQDSVMQVMKRENDGAERAVRPMTDEEIAGSLLPMFVQPDTRAILQNRIFSDPAVIKNPGDVAARLHVREDIINKTREAMDRHPEAEGLLRQMLQGIFTSDPMMEKDPPPPPPPGSPQLLKA